ALPLALHIILQRLQQAVVQSPARDQLHVGLRVSFFRKNNALAFRFRPVPRPDITLPRVPAGFRSYWPDLKIRMAGFQQSTLCIPDMAQIAFTAVGNPFLPPTLNQEGDMRNPEAALLVLVQSSSSALGWDTAFASGFRGAGINGSAIQCSRPPQLAVSF